MLIINFKTLAKANMFQTDKFDLILLENAPFNQDKVVVQLEKRTKNIAYEEYRIVDFGNFSAKTSLLMT